MPLQLFLPRPLRRLLIQRFVCVLIVPVRLTAPATTVYYNLNRSQLTITTVEYFFD